MRLQQHPNHRGPGIASNPAKLKLDWRVYHRCFPRLRREIALNGVFLGGLVGLAFLIPKTTPVLAASGLIFAPLVKRAQNAKRHFVVGDVNAAKVIDPQAGLIACFADLSTHGGAFFPTIRIMRFSLEKMSGGPYHSGDDLPAVSTYFGLGGHKWDTFNPVPAAAATANFEQLERLRESVPEWQWMFLNEALFRIPRPYLPGLYPIPLLPDDEA